MRSASAERSNASVRALVDRSSSLMSRNQIPPGLMFELLVPVEELELPDPVRRGCPDALAEGRDLEHRLHPPSGRDPQVFRDLVEELLACGGEPDLGLHASPTARR